MVLDIVLVALLTFFVSWIVGWVVVDPGAHLLDALNIRMKIDKVSQVVSVRTFLETKLNAVPGSETFMAFLIMCKMCIGSWAGLTVSIAGNLLVSRSLGGGTTVLLILVMWLGSVFFHYAVNSLLTQRI